METQDIQFLLSQLEGLTRYMVISEDEAVLKIQNSAKPLLLISNTDPSWLPGKHWVSFYFPKKGSAEFFDSFGHPPEFYSDHFVSFLQLNSSNNAYMFNRWQIQNSHSNVCGLYCVLFALSKFQNQPFISFLDTFNPVHLQQNDYTSVHLIESTFNVKLNITS
jgi:hypothetical protein